MSLFKPDQACRNCCYYLTSKKTYKNAFVARSHCTVYYDTRPAPCDAWVWKGWENVLIALLGAIFVLMTVFALTGWPNIANADEVEIQLMQKTRLADDDTYHTGGFVGVQLNYVVNDVYVFASKDYMTVSAMGEAFDYDLTGAGIGMKVVLTPTVSLFGQVGYYMVANSIGSEQSRIRNEAIEYYLNDRYSNDANPVRFDAFSVDTEDTFGITIGIEVVRPVTKHVDVGFLLSYRGMKIKEAIHGYKDVWDYAGTGEDWEYGTSRNHSSVNLGLIGRVQF